MNIDRYNGTMTTSTLTYYLNGLAKSFPITLPVAFMVNGILFQHYPSLVYSFLIIFELLMNTFIIKPLFQFLYTKYQFIDSILGQGHRPCKFCQCSCFSDQPTKLDSLSGFGMPSGHSEIAASFATYWFLHYGFSLSMDLSGLRSLMLLFTPFYIGFSRIFIQCHTLKQVLVGWFFGILFGIFNYCCLSNLFF